MNKNEVAIVTENDIRNKIYMIRGQKVMLDIHLAEIYGYETKNFNRQVANNRERFTDDFMFQLTTAEVQELSRCKNFTLNNGARGRGSNLKYRPHAFTEQGIYMLMTVLKGDLAIRQSIALIRLFKQMKDYLVDVQPLVGHRGYAAMIDQIEEHSVEIKEIKDNMVRKSDLSDFMKLFDSSRDAEEILILDGQPFKADMAYQKIYKKARREIIVIDDYLGAKTLHHIASAKKNVKITIISDNKGRQPLRMSEYNDFITEYPGRHISFVRSAKKTHDRYIVLDNGTADMKVFLCGSSSKDSGNKITTIMQVKNIANYKQTIKTLLSNPPMVLR